MNSRPRDFVLSPEFLAGVFVLAVNDRILKAAFPGLITGKLSDAAGLLFLPLLIGALCSLLEPTTSTASSRTRIHVLAAITAVVGMVFVFMKTTAAGADFYRYANSMIEWPFLAIKSIISGKSPWWWPETTIVRDSTDLLVLPVLVLSWAAGVRILRRGTRSQER